MNKRGGVGNFISMFFAIIAIAIILFVFVFISGMWKTFGEKPAGDVVSGDEGVDEGFFSYTDKEYLLLSEVRFDVAAGEDVDVVITEVGYEK